MEPIMSVQEQLVPVPLVEVQIQPTVDNKFGGSYITEAQDIQIENISCNISISSSDSVMQEHLKIHFNEQLNDKVYNTCKELFEGINMESMTEALPKVSIYNSIITRSIEEINSKYGMALLFATLEPCEVGHWAKTFLVASGNSKAPKSPRLEQTVTEWPHKQTSQPSPTITDQHPMPPWVQVQQEEVNMLTSVAAQWQAGVQQRVVNKYNAHTHRYTCNCSTPNMSPVITDNYRDCNSL